jgi:hypothetical protein
MAREKTKEARVKAEKQRLKKQYRGLDGKKNQVVAGLIDRAAFMRVELEDMEADLQENGWVEQFQQGKAPPYERARPASQQYNSTNANYTKIIKQLNDLLPDVAPTDDGDGFDDFANSRKEV